jgi:23S rRNA (cytosine1962-C5)-methyltransferase
LASQPKVLKTSADYPTVRVSRRAATRLRSGHVWVYRSDIISTTAAPPGSVVHVGDERGKLLGTAFYSSASQIALRLITRQRLAGDAPLLALLRQRVAQAVEYRRALLGGSTRETTAYRLIYSEADGLPGLVVDRYNDVLSLQTLTQAMDRPEVKETILQELISQLGSGFSVVERVEPRIRELEQLPPAPNRLLAGARSSTVYSLNGIRFHYDGLSGQKTGAFLDQRENYAAAEFYAHGRALDVFCYQGGFALHLARRCSSVTAVDSSRPALEFAEQNADLNQHDDSPEIEWIEANAFDLLKDYSASGQQYDTVILDPPAFAKSKRNLGAAIGGYKELNLRALKMLVPGGVLVTCSCSYHMSEAGFSSMLAEAAADAGKRLWVVERRGQAKDHPVLLSVPETSYLKCLICIVRN